MFHVSCLTQGDGLGPLLKWKPVSQGKPGIGGVKGNSLGGGRRGGSGTTKGKQVTAQSQHIQMHQIKNWRAALFLTIVCSEEK